MALQGKARQRLIVCVSQCVRAYFLTVIRNYSFEAKLAYCLMLRKWEGRSPDGAACGAIRVVLPDYAASGSIRATMLKFNGTVRNISNKFTFLNRNPFNLIISFF